MKYVFAGDRDIGVWVLEYLIRQNLYPELLLISSPDQASHSKELIQLSGLPKSKIIAGNDFKKSENIKILKEVNPDYIFGIHFPYLVPESIINIPKKGFLNLHPAFLPYNRGWHTPSWAILDGTPIGATLHYMSKKIDAGDIIHQKEVEIKPEYTANSLYKRLKRVELEVFKEIFPKLKSGSVPSREQDLTKGTSHRKKDLFVEKVQKVELNKKYSGKELVDKFRALTTNNLSEAAYFEENGQKYRIQIRIIPDE